MAIIVTEALMHSTSTRHVARHEGDGAWRVSWLPDRTLTRNEALTARRLAEAIDSGLERGNQRWPHIKGWAAELGMSSAAAIIRVGTSDPGGTQS
jgi:hypothetical protein